MLVDSLYSKRAGHAECVICGEEFKPEMVLGEITKWDCQRCDAKLVVKKVEPNVFGVALAEELR
jgi:DNA-directed RNA polymerase subunit RPC12/RpoP